MSNKANVFDVNKVLNIAQNRCADLNISVVFKADAKTAYTNGQTIVLPYVGHPISKDSLDELYGMVIHECGHHLRPQAFKILKSANPPAHVCALFNITEDDGMERERAKAWRGDCKALSRMNSLIVDRVDESWSKHTKNGLPKGQDPAPMAAMTIGQLSRLNWDKESGPVVDQLINHLPKEVKDLVAELEHEGWVRRYRDTTTVNQTWDAAVDLAKRLYPNNNQDEYEEIRAAGHEGKPARDASGDTMDDSQNGKPSKGKPVENDDELASDVEQSLAEGANISWKDCVLSEHNEWSEGPGGSLGITWEGRNAEGGVGLMPTKLVNVVDLKNDSHKTGYKEFSTDSWQMYMPTDGQSRTFANKIRRYIQSLARSTVDRDKYHGRLDKSAIVRLALPPIDGGEYNKKIFYDQRKHTVKDTCIFVLVDWSGSMRGTKQKHAADAAQRLVHTFDRVLNIPVALAAFSNARSQCDIGYIKKWNTRGLSKEEVAKRFSKFEEFTAGNNDADSVNWAWNEIRGRKESRKILIVLSDGAPAGSWRGHASDALKYITSAIEKDGKVELYGVGVCSEAVKSYYTNWIYLQDSHDINNTLFKLIKDGDNVKRR